jgi:hypothetical protein
MPKITVIYIWKLNIYINVIWPSYILALNNEPVIKSLLEMGFTFTDVTYAVNEYTKQEGKQ